jgi:hypothetical protein
MPRLLYTVWAAIMLCAGMPVFGQDSQDDIIRKLISRVEALEREVASLSQGPRPSLWLLLLRPSLCR